MSKRHLAKYPPRSARNVPEPHDGARSLKNKLLLALPPNEYALLLSQTDPEQFTTARCSPRTGTKIKFGYFPNTAMSSVLNLMADGKCVEVGLVGTEGMVGLPLMANLNSSPNLTVIQAPGTLFRINVQEFKAILPDCPQLNRIGTLCSSCCPGDNADCRLQSPASATARMPRSVLTEPKPPVESPSWSRRKC